MVPLSHKNAVRQRKKKCQLADGEIDPGAYCGDVAWHHRRRMWCSQTAQQGHAWPPVIPGSGTIEHRTQQVNRSAAIKAKNLVRSPDAKKSSAMPWCPPATSDKQTSLAKIESNRQSGLEENRSPSQARNALSVAYVRYTGYFICFKRREKSCQNNHGIFTEQWLAVSRNHRLVSRLIRLFSTAGCVELTGRKKARQWVLPAALLRAQQQAVRKRGKGKPDNYAQPG